MVSLAKVVPGIRGSGGERLANSLPELFHDAQFYLDMVSNIFVQ